MCQHKRKELQNFSGDGALKYGDYCEECQLDLQALKKCECEKAAVYELLKTRMVNGLVQVFTRYHDGEDTLVVNEKPFDQKRITNFLKDVLKGKFSGLRRLISRYPTNFMTSLVRWRHCLLFKRYLIIIYLRKKKLIEKQTKKLKSV